jgi:Uma2 family endonuclease
MTRALPETDGVPLESPWHFLSIGLLYDVLTHLWWARADYFVGGNMFVYYSLSRPQGQDFRGPDFFYVAGVERRPRTKWVVWAEGGKYPDLIVELLSPSTAQADRTTKKELYERVFRTPEYFLFDPETNALEGWQLGRRRYQALEPDQHGRLWSEELGLWLGPWQGKYQEHEATWLRCYDASGDLVPTAAEAAQAEVTRLRARIAELESKQSA